MESVLRQHLDVLTVIFDSELRSLVKLTLEGDGHRVLESGGYLQATAKLIEGLDPDVILLECGKAPSDVLEFRQLLKRAFKERLVLIDRKSVVEGKRVDL